MQLHVVVEKHDVFSLTGEDAQVDGAREGVVVVELHDRDAWPVTAQRCSRLVGRAVVDHDHAVVERLRRQVPQAD